MKLIEAIQNLGEKKATTIAHQLANEMSIDWDAGACFVFKVITNDPNRVPGNIGGVNDNEHTAIKKMASKVPDRKGRLRQ